MEYVLTFLITNHKHIKFPIKHFLSYINFSCITFMEAIPRYALSKIVVNLVETHSDYH